MRWRSAVSVMLLAANAAVAAQNDAYERVVLDRTVAAVEKTQPEWRFIPAICGSGCLRVMDEEVGQVGGTWNRADADQWRIGVSIHRVTTPDAGVRWLSRFLTATPRGWSVQPYQLGDGGVLAAYPDPRGFTQFNMMFRKGVILVTLSGRSQATMEMFAASVLTANTN